MLYKHISPLTEQVWADEFWPRIEAARGLPMRCTLLAIGLLIATLAKATPRSRSKTRRCRPAEPDRRVRCLVCQNQTIKTQRSSRRTCGARSAD